MIWRKATREETAQDTDELSPMGFDDFDMRLGDMMRGERATMSKSLLDVQRELRIKAKYISAIENCDPDAFETPGFIAGYVRSYARYLNLDPDEAFRRFCAESGFTTAHGMAPAASGLRAQSAAEAPPAVERDVFADPKLPFAPANESLFSRIEPGAVGSFLVLVALIAGIGYGGWSVLQEIQRVNLAPVDQSPIVLADLDPLSAADTPQTEDPDAVAAAGAFSPPSRDVLDRIYRPEALDLPIMTPRDAPISTLDPSRTGTFAEAAGETTPSIATASADASDVAPGSSLAETRLPQVNTPGLPGVRLVAVRPAWVRVRAKDGSVLFEGVLNAGDTYDVPRTEEVPTLRVGASGAIYFAINEHTYGPAGPRGAVTSNIGLTADALLAKYEPAELSRDADLERMVAQMNLRTGPLPGASPAQ